MAKISKIQAIALKWLLHTQEWMYVVTILMLCRMLHVFSICIESSNQNTDSYLKLV